jgi:hypothetical protein
MGKRFPASGDERKNEKAKGKYERSEKRGPYTGSKSLEEGESKNLNFELPENQGGPLPTNTMWHPTNLSGINVTSMGVATMMGHCCIKYHQHAAHYCRKHIILLEDYPKPDVLIK